MNAESNASPLRGLLLSQDLFFTSKITGTASALGMQVEVDGNRERALTKAGTGAYGCILLDLGWKNFAVADLMAVLPAAQAPSVVAFGSHVDTGRLDEARVAGCVEVLPRSKFSATLPELLSRYLGTS